MTYKFTKDLSYGSYGSDVYQLQSALERLGYGYFIKFLPSIFGPKTQSAVSRFQVTNNISPASGYFGPKTRTALIQAMMDLERESIYKAAVAFLGKDASPNDVAPDEYGCADSVCGVLFKALGYPGFDWTISTSQLYASLLGSKEWMLIDQSQAKRGDVLVSPTGTSSILNTPITNGHTGIVGDNQRIMSNNSYKGVFEDNYSFQEWSNRYVGKGGYKMFFFRKV